jgi:PD-(D/E)XK nuclease superfamily
MVSQLDKLSDDIRKLIKGLDAIKERRDTFIKATKARFNVFTTLRKAHEEVGLHSRFLALLLNAKGLHDCESLFLDLFIEVLNEKGVLNHKGDSCGIPFLKEGRQGAFDKIEHETRIKDYGQIDIGVFFKEAALIIENKIYANEQEEQISNYSKRLDSMIQKNKAAVLYLTLDGKESETAGEYKGNYYRISYSEHILEWLDRCLEKTYKWPNINTAIQQYRDVVAELVGKNTLAETNMSEMEELMKELIKKHPDLSDLFKYASTINQVVEQLKSDYLRSFWKSLKDEIKNRKIVTDGKEICDKYYVGLFLANQYDLCGQDNKYRYRFWFDMSEDNVKKSKKGFFYGICLVDHPDAEKKEYFNQYKDEFTRIRALVKDSKDGYDIITEADEWWPLGRTRLFTPEDEWFAKMIKDGSHEEEAKNAAEKLDKYIKFVTAEWNKAVKSNSNQAS